MFRFLTLILATLFVGSTVSAQLRYEADLASQKEKADDFVVSGGLHYEAGRGLDSSGGWMQESWGTLKSADAVIRDAEIEAVFPPVGTGNPKTYAELLIRATALANSGTGLRIYGGQDKATIALIDKGKEIRSEKMEGLSPATKTVTVVLTVNGANIRAKVLQGDDFEESISGRIKEATDDGYFLFRAKSANQGPVLASLKISGEGIGRKPPGVSWPPPPDPAKTTTPTNSPATTASAKKEPAKPLEPYPVPVRDFLLQDVRVLSPEWICLVLDSTPAVPIVLDQDEAAKAELAIAEKEKGGSRDWYYKMAIQYVYKAISTRIRAGLIPKLDQTANWRAAGVEPKVASFFPSAVDAMPRTDASFSGEKISGAARVAEYVYLKLAQPLADGSVLPIQHRDGLKTQLNFSSRKSVCWGLKVNQAGYLPKSKKYAYLGMWAGFEGTVDYSAFAGKPFAIRKFSLGENWRTGEAAESEPVFSGTIQLRAKAADQAVPEFANVVTGEDVYELDFSELTEPGWYCVHVEGLGRSWPFRVGGDVYGEAFFHTARALYHQRGTITLDAQHTAWTRDRTRQPILRGGYIPETDRWYDKRLLYAKEHPDDPKAGFRDEAGNPIGLSPFTMIHSTATTEPYPGMETGGGWHDAADYDRRVHHYSCVWDLCGAYEMYPEKFVDGQLHIPESGNGIPDILDEAAVQIDFFLKTQQPNGGVSSWAEQISHPHHEGGPAEDTQPFYISLPDRAGSLQFAACAAYLGRMMQPFDEARSKRYFTAATKAFEFGANPENRIKDVTFTVAEGSRYDSNLIGKTITFNEAVKLKSLGANGHNLHYVNALVQLAAAGSETHKAMLTGIDIGKTQIDWMVGGRQPFNMVTPLLHPEKVGLTEPEKQAFLDRLVEESEKSCHGGQDTLAYRQMWRSPNGPGYLSMAWGYSHGPSAARVPLLLYRITGEETWRQRVLFALDWEYGCNATGRTMTTGVGSVFPVVFQHIHSEADGILEAVPGFTPFAPTGTLPFHAFTNQFALIEGAPHSSVKHFFPPTAWCLIPDAAGRSELQKKIAGLPSLANNEAYQIVKSAVAPKIPIMRRFYLHPNQSPGHNEFTVNESISTHAAVLGAFLPEGWMPSEAMKNRRPEEKAADLPMYPQP